MRLSAILPEIPGATARGPDVEVASVVYDSREAGPGALFVAVPGLKADGHDYLAQALSRGAAAAAVQAGMEAKWESVLSRTAVPCLVLPDTRAGLAQIAAAMVGRPARRLGVIGVTGTDGKTSLCHLIDHVLRAAGQPAGLISTAECRIGDRQLADTGRFTTPEAPELQGMIREIADAGCRWAVIEATSHGLALHRLDACEFDVAAVTCVGADHLDFHGTPEAYLAAKGRLFEMVGESVNKGIDKAAVLNADDRSFQYLRSVAGGPVVAYGFDHGDVTALDVREEGWASRFTVRAGGAEIPMTMPRPGRFNVANALAATAVCLRAGLGLESIPTGVASWQGAPGRLQFVDEGQPFTVVIDFAHSADALRRVLEMLRGRSRGRIIAVFGSIGERERDRRAAMGRVAAEAADFTIITDDNPYTEDRDVILKEIAMGLLSAGRREGHDFAVIADRREAIAHALGMAVDEDVVLLAGKGHEREVHIGDSVYECDDREVARLYLRGLRA